MRCWNESPSARPTAQDLLRCLHDISTAWEPSLEYTIPDDLYEWIAPEFISRSEQVMAADALKSSFFSLLIAVFCIFMFSFN